MSLFVNDQLAVFFICSLPYVKTGIQVYLPMLCGRSHRGEHRLLRSRKVQWWSPLFAAYRYVSQSKSVRFLGSFSSHWSCQWHYWKTVIWRASKRHFSDQHTTTLGSSTLSFQLRFPSTATRSQNIYLLLLIKWLLATIRDPNDYVRVWLYLLMQDVEETRL